MKEVIIPVGWSVFFDAVSKKATGYSEFKKASKANTGLSVLSAATEAALVTLCNAQGIILPPKKK